MNGGVIFKENLQNNLREIENKKTILTSQPIKLNVVLTTKCNLFCLMCEVRKLSWQAPSRIVKEVVSLFPYLQEIVWQGGEVFLLDYFKELLNEAGPYSNLTHEITTNGHLIDERWIEVLNKINLNLNISIDGVTKGTYEYIRKGSKFEDLTRAISLINEAKGTVAGKKLTLVLIVTVMRSNYHELEKIMDFAARYRFDRVILQPVKANRENGENIFFNNEREILRYIDEVKQRMKVEAKRLNIKLVEWLPTSSRLERKIYSGEGAKGKSATLSGDNLFCHAPWQQMFIEWGGNVYPHCHCIQESGNDSKAIGNVSQEELSEIWNGERMQIFRRGISNNDYGNLCNPDCLNGLISQDIRDIPLALECYERHL